jgi:hypothetical protein
LPRDCGRKPPLNAKTLTPATRHQPSRRALCAALLLTALLGVLVQAVPAAAAQSCGRKVIDDWWDGRIDGTYALHCYDDAIEILPRDVRDYSSAEDDIKRALQAALRGEKAPPNKAQDEPDEEPAVTPPSKPPADPPAAEDTPAGGDDPEAAPPLDESASSVPIPLLILAGLALVLVLAGSAGYLIRRFQSRRIPPPAP